MTAMPIQKQTDEVRSLIEERLKIKGRTLEHALAKAGRLLPKWARRDGAFLVLAEHHLGHPKLRLTVDVAKVDKAHQGLVAHLKTIDPSERLKSSILSMLGVISFNLILVIGALIMFLWWRGFV